MSHMLKDLAIRPRRLRQTPYLRDLVEEGVLTPNDLIIPLFVLEEGEKRSEIKSLPGIFRIPLQELQEEVEELLSLGAKALMLFPVLPYEKRDFYGREAFKEDGIIPKAIRLIKSYNKELVVFSDVALDPYTSHGHDGITDESETRVLNDETVEALCLQSLVLAQAGVDFVAPSDMMDGRVQAIRQALDHKGFKDVGILSYSAKFNSSLYGPFRDALQSKSRGLDKKTYQLSTFNTRQALREAVLDEEEGADMVMVKPGMLYLDILSKIREVSPLPLAIYHVSGEYAMMKAAVERGWLDEKALVKEVLSSFKRAGADLIVSYYGKWALKNLFRTES
jgi:porphobilinogen synthase